MRTDFPEQLFNLITNIGLFYIIDLFGNDVAVSVIPQVNRCFFRLRIGIHAGYFNVKAVAKIAVNHLF